jgi:hypothetical protein
MPVEFLTRCDSPGCQSYQRTPVGQPPVNWLSINGQWMFCSWTCVAICAAQVASEEKAQAEQAAAESVNGAEPDAEVPEPEPEPAMVAPGPAPKRGRNRP